jgi:hypothetical protein
LKTLFAAVLVVATINKAEAREALGSSFGSSFEPYIGSGFDYRAPSSYSHRKAKRAFRIGALMLGIGWAVPAMAGLVVMDAGDTAMGARMFIPYVGLSEAGVAVAEEAISLAIPMFIPTIVQLVGTGFTIAGVYRKTRQTSYQFSAAPLLYKEGGGGVGMSLTM